MQVAKYISCNQLLANNLNVHDESPSSRPGLEDELIKVPSLGCLQLAVVLILEALDERGDFLLGNKADNATTPACASQPESKKTSLLFKLFNVINRF